MRFLLNETGSHVDKRSGGIAVQQPQADIIRWAFEEIAKGVYNTEQVYNMVKAQGLRTAKSLFWVALRNPVYCGKIFIPKYKDDGSTFVKGQHETYNW